MGSCSYDGMGEISHLEVRMQRKLWGRRAVMCVDPSWEE